MHLHGHLSGQRHRTGGGVRDWARHRVRADLSADSRDTPGGEPAAAGGDRDGQARRRGGHRRRRGAVRPASPREPRRGRVLRVRPRCDGRAGPRGAAGDDVGLPGGSRTPDGEPQRAHQAACGGGGPRVDHDHLYRQDRHAHQGRDDGADGLAVGAVPCRFRRRVRPRRQRRGSPSGGRAAPGRGAVLRRTTAGTRPGPPGGLEGARRHDRGRHPGRRWQGEAGPRRGVAALPARRHVPLRRRSQADDDRPPDRGGIRGLRQGIAPGRARPLRLACLGGTRVAPRRRAAASGREGERRHGLRGPARARRGAGSRRERPPPSRAGRAGPHAPRSDRHVRSAPAGGRRRRHGLPGGRHPHLHDHRGLRPDRRGDRPTGRDRHRGSGEDRVGARARLDE